MKKNGFKIGKTEKAILVFVRKLDKETHRAPFSPKILIKKGYQRDPRTLLNTLPRLAKKGFLVRLYRGMYKSVFPGSRRVVAKEKRSIPIPRKKLTPDEWRMRIDAAMEKIAEEVKACDRKIEECHETIKQAQADIEVWKSEKKKAEKKLEEFKKVHETFMRAPEGFGEIVEALRTIGG